MSAQQLRIRWESGEREDQDVSLGFSGVVSAATARLEGVREWGRLPTIPRGYLGTNLVRQAQAMKRIGQDIKREGMTLVGREGDRDGGEWLIYEKPARRRKAPAKVSIPRWALEVEDKTLKAPARAYLLLMGETRESHEHTNEGQGFYHHGQEHEDRYSCGCIVNTRDEEDGTHSVVPCERHRLVFYGRCWRCGESAEGRGDECWYCESGKVSEEEIHEAQTA